MKEEHEFDRIIAASLKKREEEKAEIARVSAEEELRKKLNREKMLGILNQEVLPEFLEAAAAVERHGGYADVQRVRSEMKARDTIVLIVSLQASLQKGGIPQTYKEISYQGEPDTMGFTMTCAGQTHKLLASDITPATVSETVKRFLESL